MRPELNQHVQDSEIVNESQSMYNEQIINDPMSAQLIRWQEDLDPILEELEHHWRSEYFNSKFKMWMPIQISTYDEQGNKVMKDMSPLLDEMSIHELRSMLKPIVHQNTMLGKHKGTRVGKIAVELAGEISSYLFGLIWDGSINIATASLIDSSSSTLIFNTFNRGEENLERRYNRETNKNINTFSHSSGKNKEALING